MVVILVGADITVRARVHAAVLKWMSGAHVILRAGITGCTGNPARNVRVIGALGLPRVDHLWVQQEGIVIGGARVGCLEPVHAIPAEVSEDAAHVRGSE